MSIDGMKMHNVSFLSEEKKLRGIDRELKSIILIAILEPILKRIWTSGPIIPNIYPRKC